MTTSSVPAPDDRTTTADTGGDAAALPSRSAVSPISKWTNLLITTSTLLVLLLFVAVLFRLGMAISHTLLIFALGTVVAYALDPLVDWLRRPILPKGRAFSRKGSIALVFIALLALCGGGFWWLGGRAAHEISVVQRDYPGYRARAEAMADRLDQQLAAHGIAFSIRASIENPPPQVREFESRLGTQAFTFVRHFFGGVAESLIVLLISLYLLLLGDDMREKFNGSLPRDLRPYVEHWQEDVHRILGGFVRGQVSIALVVGASSAVFCLALGIHLWLLIGLFVTITALIPVFGPYIGAAPAILAGIVGPTHLHSPVIAAVALLVFFVVINEIGSKILYPRLVGQALGLHQVLVLFVLFAGLELGSIVGTLFAAPATALVMVTVRHLYRYWQQVPDDLIADTATPR